MKFRFLLVLVSLLTVVSVISGCTSFGRTGYGPYNTADYGALEAQQDLNDYLTGN